MNRKKEGRKNGKKEGRKNRRKEGRKEGRNKTPSWRESGAILTQRESLVHQSVPRV